MAEGEKNKVKKMCLFFYPSFSSSVQSLSRVRLSATPWTAARQASLSVTSSSELTQSHVHRVGDAIQPSHPLPSPSPPAFNLPQRQGLFQGVRSSHRVTKGSCFLYLIIFCMCSVFPWAFSSSGK